MTFKDDRIEKWMTKNPQLMSLADSLRRTIEVMRRYRIGAVLVVNEREQLKGIFTERDLLRFVEEFADPGFLEQPISCFMTRAPVSVSVDESFNAVYMKMKVNNIRHLPVLDGERIVGIVSMRDLTAYYERKIESDLDNTRAQLDQLRRFFDLSANREGERILSELERLEALSLTDFLTGLYNTRYFSSRLKEEVSRSRRHRTHLSLIFCDIDFFKKVNDQYGHQVGDLVLKEVARLLISRVEEIKIVARLRKSDVVARYGGEEFVVILPETDKENAALVAERMRQAVAGHVFTGGEEKISITMSFGVAEYPQDGGNSDELIGCADAAMYQAKKSGRNRVVVYAPGVMAEA
ncbi:MAG: GGDEF domain-containing protein [Deltaproteobacteria bacterium]|nr:GGDEF domain-containing protein [Deltaproteobacteria bacterium]